MSLFNHNIESALSFKPQSSTSKRINLLETVKKSWKKGEIILNKKVVVSLVGTGLAIMAGVTSLSQQNSTIIDGGTSPQIGLPDVNPVIGGGDAAGSCFGVGGKDALFSMQQANQLGANDTYDCIENYPCDSAIKTTCGTDSQFGATMFYRTWCEGATTFCFDTSPGDCSEKGTTLKARSISNTEAADKVDLSGGSTGRYTVCRVKK